MRGYSRAITPTVEYYDLFDDDMLGIPQEQMYKLTSVSGRIMALRPGYDHSDSAAGFHPA